MHPRLRAGWRQLATRGTAAATVATGREGGCHSAPERVLVGAEIEPSYRLDGQTERRRQRDIGDFGI